jgi:hypothetical protein
MPAPKMIRFHEVRKMAGYKNNCFSNARSRQRPVDQSCLCGKVQSHPTSALAVANGSTSEFMKDSPFPFPYDNSNRDGKRTPVRLHANRQNLFSPEYIKHTLVPGGVKPAPLEQN